MAVPAPSFVLGGVPTIQNLEYPDIFAGALGVAFCYGNSSAHEGSALLRGYRLTPGHRAGIYGAISAVTGRGWRIGFDEGGSELGSGREPAASFAVAGLDATLEHHDTLWQAVSLLGRVPEVLWNQDCEGAPHEHGAAGFVNASTQVDGPTFRRYVVDYLTLRRQPLIVLLRVPSVPIVEFALLTGYEDDGDIILGRSPYLGPPSDGSGPDAYFRMAEWEPGVLAAIGIAEASKTDLTPQRIGYLAIENALKHSRSYSDGSRHYGLAAYDAWERALLDDEAVADASDEVVAQRLQRHSITAGFIASQKAFCVMPEFETPTMGVVTGLARRAAAGPGLIHGLMWDAWQVVGGYWRGTGSEGEDHRRWAGTGEVQRFRERTVRERAAAVVRRAREVDAQALADLRAAKEEWDRCRGRGGDYRCPCWSRPCARV